MIKLDRSEIGPMYPFLNSNVDRKQLPCYNSANQER